jgi:hypothetical protein
LEEIDDFKRFHISAAPAQLSGQGASPDFGRIAADAGAGHFWLDADAIIELSAKAGDDAWQSAFWDMLAKAEPYGFADVGGRRLKAHVA